MSMLWQCLFVGAGGFLGAIARYLVSILCLRLFGTVFPIGTLAVNLTGSALLGWFLANRESTSDSARLAIAVGFLGAYTTFSTFAYESDALLRNGAGLKAAANLLGSLALGLAAVRLGLWLGHRSP